MILILAGTSDGRELAQLIANQGYQVIASVTSDYGAILAQSNKLNVITGKLGLEELIQLIKQKQIKILVDATHPYAENASRNAIAACESTSTHYMRYERPTVIVKDDPNLKFASSYLEAAQIANQYTGRVFLTTGSNHLELFANEISDKSRIITRVLPSADIMKKCIDLGLQPSQIIAMQGPFSRELNREMFRHYQANLIITKESGSIGGIDEKVLAAQDLSIVTIVINRPSLQYPCLVSNNEEALERIRLWEK